MENFHYAGINAFYPLVYSTMHKQIPFLYRTVVNVSNHDRLQLCLFGGGHSLAYVLDNDLYYLPENSEQAIRITDDGIPRIIYNGHADWVYEGDVLYYYLYNNNVYVKLINLESLEVVVASKFATKRL